MSILRWHTVALICQNRAEQEISVHYVTNTGLAAENRYRKDYNCEVCRLTPTTYVSIVLQAFAW